MSKRPCLRQHLAGKIEGEGVGLDRVAGGHRVGVHRVLGAPGERLLQLLLFDVQVDRIGGQTPVDPRGDAVAECLDKTDVAALEPELDPGTGERVRPGALPFQAWLTHQHPEAGGLIELHGVAASREVAAVDGHPAPAPHAVVPLEPHAVADDDVRLARVRRRAIVDRGPTGRVQLERVAHALHGPVVGEVGAPQHRTAVPIDRDDVLMRFETFLSEKIGGRRGVERDGRVANVHRVPLADHV